MGVLYSDGFVHAFLYDNGIYTTLPDLPRAYGINDAGDVVGGGSVLYSDGTFTTLPGPTGGGVADLGINNMGQIVGYYTDGGRQHGFVADPNPVMSDAVKAQGSLTTLNGTSVGDGTVSAYDGTQLIGTTTAASDGTWSLQAHLTGGAIHSFTETATDLQGNAASSAGVTLYSNSQNKSLVGGTGDDVLIGDKGDQLTGGVGADTFVFNPNLGKETVADFNASQDILAFDHTLFTNATASQVLSQTHDSSAGAVIAVDAHDTVTLTGVTVAQLHASVFHFF